MSQEEGPLRKENIENRCKYDFWNISIKYYI